MPGKTEYLLFEENQLGFGLNEVVLRSAKKIAIWVPEDKGYVPLGCITLLDADKKEIATNNSNSKYSDVKLQERLRKRLEELAKKYFTSDAPKEGFEEFAEGYFTSDNPTEASDDEDYTKEKITLHSPTDYGKENESNSLSNSSDSVKVASRGSSPCFFKEAKLHILALKRVHLLVEGGYIRRTTSFPELFLTNSSPELRK